MTAGGFRGACVCPQMQRDGGPCQPGVGAFTRRFTPLFLSGRRPTPSPTTALVARIRRINSPTTNTVEAWQLIPFHAFLKINDSLEERPR